MFLELKKCSRLRLQDEVLSMISMVALKTALIRFHFSRLQTALAALVLSKGSSTKRQAVH